MGAGTAIHTSKSRQEARRCNACSKPWCSPAGAEVFLNYRSPHPGRGVLLTRSPDSAGPESRGRVTCWGQSAGRGGLGVQAVKRFKRVTAEHTQRAHCRRNGARLPLCPSARTQARLSFWRRPGARLALEMRLLFPGVLWAGNTAHMPPSHAAPLGVWDKHAIKSTPPSATDYEYPH